MGGNSVEGEIKGVEQKRLTHLDKLKVECQKKCPMKVQRFEQVMERQLTPQEKAEKLLGCKKACKR
eukprot:NODE_2972_length_433_cov_178.565104_g2470_i0.p1 GENE.NODE_2972_length_433_cov_178.565104_g2470_i0~~NODE_2972_length_433_cov_178.565104_g2470_i0.p1  ORF type:complete len:77 (-),score=25.35 NODE_2972_length_433_cov_178.565104_g2470_i0:202-399(-)